ncbi:metallophosphoesterase [Chondromyces crocatus]|uniref:Metallophosphatase n=1 Tax=Chondromyces crocatus TaxID=52 RepID=A0A0K1ET73_CHOCO|nr:metallophosphoesterase [Chondromyces crocatus]AKT43833.1 metallophosphatase [Chondromyces crocatus]
MPRTIIVGDVHGCRDELAALLERIGLAATDRLVMVGDLIVRGPDPCGTLDLLREVGAISVRGNHEDRLLRWHAGKGDSSGEPLGEMSKATARLLRKRDWAWLETLPYWIDLPEQGIRVVHAGVVPGLPIERQDPHTLMYVRCLGRYGEPVERRGGKRLWGETYVGPPHLVFGHNAKPEPQLHSWATGIDTGAVYGGRLTAMVLREGEMVPPAASRLDVLVSVPSRRRYCGKI